MGCCEDCCLWEVIEMFLVKGCVDFVVEGNCKRCGGF